MTNANRKTGRMPLVVALAGILAVLLTGCMRAQFDYTVNADDTLTASGIVAYDDDFLAQLAELQGVPADELLEQMRGQTNPEEWLDIEGGAEVKDYAKDGYTGWSFTAKDPQPLDTLNDSAAEDGVGEMSLIRKGDEFILSGELDMTEEGMGSTLPGEDDPESQEMLDRLDLKFSFTFPGKVKSSSGAIDGNKVTFTPKVGEVTRFDAVASAKAGMGSLLVILGIAVGAIAVIAVLAILLLKAKKKRAAAQAAPEPPADPGYPGQAYPPPGQPAFGAPPAGGFPPPGAQPPFAAPPAAGYPAAPGYPPAGAPNGLPAPGYQPPAYGPGPGADDAPPPLSQPVARPGETPAGAAQPPAPEQPAWPQQPPAPEQPAWPQQQAAPAQAPWPQQPMPPEQQAWPQQPPAPGQPAWPEQQAAPEQQAWPQQPPAPGQPGWPQQQQWPQQQWPPAQQ
jgi:hypothetical protein